MTGFKQTDRVADHYDSNADFADNLNHLIPGFEYPNWSHRTIGEVLDTVSAQHVKVIEDSLKGIQFQFNDRSAGIFADGYKDRDGLPVGDTFVYRLRAQLNGAVARDWTKEQNAALVASYSSAEMNEIMNGVEKTITEGAKLTDVLTANLGRSDTWREHDNLAMRYMEECDLIGGETDCHPSMANALPHEMTFAEFAKIARVEKLENHGRQSEVFIGDKSLGFCDFPGGDDALRQAHVREINNAIYVNAPEAVDFMEKVSFPPAHVLAEYPELMEVWADVLKGRELVSRDVLVKLVGQDDVVSERFEDDEHMTAREIAGKQCVFASTGNSQPYGGKVIGATDHYVIQNLGKNAVLHLKSRLDRVPGEGEMINVVYDGLQGKVEPRGQAQDQSKSR